MALTKAFLKETLSKAGVESEQLADVVGKILDGHTASIDALREERDGYKAELDKLQVDQKELEDLKAKAGKYDELQKEYSDFKTKVESDKVRGAKETAYREILKEAGIPDRHYAKILKYSDVDGVELDDEGKITNAKDIMKNVKEEWGDHIENTTVSGAKTPTPPANVGGTQKTLKEIMTIKDTSARQAEIANLLQNQSNK